MTLTFEHRLDGERLGLRRLQSFVVGDAVRDYIITAPLWVVWPHGKSFEVLPLSQIPDVARHLWPARTPLARKNLEPNGGPWSIVVRISRTVSKQTSNIFIDSLCFFAFVATHNHFVLDRGGNVFKQSALVIKLRGDADENDYLGLLGLLNSSAACFWMKQVFHNKGSTVDERGARQRTDPFEDFYEITSTGLHDFPLPSISPVDLARSIDVWAQHLSSSLPRALCNRLIPTRTSLRAAQEAAAVARNAMFAFQEELDWRCYRLYGLLDDSPEHPDPPPLRFGERAFEVVMARQIADGTLETAWFTRHRSTPITDLPAHWPGDYRAIVERRIALIESNPTINLKRSWPDYGLRSREIALRPPRQRHALPRWCCACCRSIRGRPAARLQLSGRLSRTLP
jgi:hypothetical protein